MSGDIQTTAELAENAALPRRFEVHTDGSKSGTVAVAESAQSRPQNRKSPAEWAYERLILYIKDFEERLGENEEIAIAYTGAEAGVMRIEGMGFFDPDIITFYGRESTGARTQLVQHVTQLNVMLRAMPKPVPEAEPMRIGFRLERELGAATSQVPAKETAAAETAVEDS